MYILNLALKLHIIKDGNYPYLTAVMSRSNFWWEKKQWHYMDLYQRQ